MENDLEYIDDYFGGRMPPIEKAQFEQKVLEDPNFAEDVTFYLTTRQVAMDQSKEEKKGLFWEMYRKGNPVQTGRAAKGLWPSIAVAASFLAFLIALYLFTRPASQKQLADQYIQQHFQTLGISMGSKNDSMQTGLRLYNDRKWAEALQQFENIIRSDKSQFEATKYAGIVSLQLGNYDKALTYFGQLAAYKLYANPGLFYEAVTLIERNRPSDPQQAKLLLEQVVQNKLEGHEIAEKWLSKS